MVRVELKCQSDFSDIALVFNHLLDSFELELRGKGAFSSTSFEHASPHFHCFNINRISRCPELPIHYKAIDDFPLAYRTVTDGTAEDISAQWQFRKLQTLAMQNYTRYAPQVQQRYQQLEIHFEVLRQEMEREYLSIYRSDSLKARLLIQQFCAQACAEALTVTQELTNQLFTQLAQDVNSKYLFSGA
ncbi:Uncharacterised protein [Edwardsiella tarda]|nr:Uncharacterised protein [Edwardsiella tarda]